MRSPLLRVVRDDDVDRAQVHGQRCPEPSATNSPKSFRREAPVCCPCEVVSSWIAVCVPSSCQSAVPCGARARVSVAESRSSGKETHSGGYSRGVPPLPIPNREVKPARADGTAPQCGRVGRRRLSGAPSLFGRALFLVC